VLCRPCMWVPDIVIIFLCVTSKQWIEKGHQRDANLCGAYSRPTNERSLVRGGEGYNQGSFVYFTKACGVWVFAGVNGVNCVDV